MPAQRTFGMDHPHHEWSPIISRPALRWPNNARVALCVVLVLEQMEWQAPEGSYQVANLAGGSAPRAFPDYARLPTGSTGIASASSGCWTRSRSTASRPPSPWTPSPPKTIRSSYKHCVDRGCEIIGHGVSVSRMITSNMSEEEEREYIRSSVDALTRATGKAPQGWLGPEYGESDRTPQLLAEAGLRYVCDWANDEQPYPMTTGDNPFFALPLLYELDDVASLAQRKVTVTDYQRRLTESFDVLHDDGATTGRRHGA